MEKEFDCYTCKHRRGIPGDCHSCCKHPSLGDVPDNALIGLMGILAGAGRVPGFQVNSKELNIKGNPHGIRNGWFNFPVNFDPTWLENCDGYENKNKEEKKDGKEEASIQEGG